MDSKELQDFFKEYLSKNPSKLESNQKKLGYITREEILYRLNNSPRIASSIKARMKRRCNCYFCGWDLVIHKHHIIPRKMCGPNVEDNILKLCPNHHWAIHHKKYKLLFEDGFFFLINTSDNTDLVLPNRVQWGYKRKDPNILWHKALEIMDKKGIIIHDKKEEKRDERKRGKSKK